MKRIGFLVVALGMLGLNACGGSDLEGKCKDSCSDKACYDGQTPTDSEVTQCKTLCEQSFKALDETGCTDEAEKVNDCEGSLDCSSSSTSSTKDCTSQESAFASCLEKYCSAHSGSTNAFCSANN